MKRNVAVFLLMPAVILLMAAISESTTKIGADGNELRSSTVDNAKHLIEQGRQIFRFDTYGDEAFWTNQLHMQQSVMRLSPQTALALGLKVDAEALPPSVIQAIQLGKVNLGDPAVTLQLIRQNAVLGVVGTFNGNTLTKVGFTCA